MSWCYAGWRTGRGNRTDSICEIILNGYNSNTLSRSARAASKFAATLWKTKNLKHLALLKTAYSAGLRVGEVVELEVNQVHLTLGRTPHLRVMGKGRRERIVYLSATAAQYLRAYLARRPAGAKERVFLNQHGQPITITGIQWQLAGYCRQAGIWLTCHQLRHTFASRLIAADVPVTSVQKLLGHASLRTTQLYIQIADSQVERDYHAGMQRLLSSHKGLEVGT